MNKIFRVVFNKNKGLFTVVHEQAKTEGKASLKSEKSETHGSDYKQHLVGMHSNFAMPLTVAGKCDQSLRLGGGKT